MIMNEEFLKQHHDLVTKAVDRNMEELKKEHGEMMKTFRKELDGVTDRVEEIESKGSRPGKTSSDGMTTKQHEHMKVFRKAFRGRFADPSSVIELRNVEAALGIETKDVTIGSLPGGGYALPELISREIGRLELNFSPVRRLVKVVRVSTSDYKELVSKRGTSSGWVGETGTRTATLTSQLRERAMTHGELYAYPQASNWSLDDLLFDVGAWIAEEVAQKFAEQEGIAVISGNGTSKPTGMINTAPVATADFASPERSANAYQLVTSDLTPGGVGVVGDALVDLYFTLNASYRSQSTWVMSSATAAAIRKLKDTTNQYLWQPGLQAGAPDMLLGRPVEIWENMPAIGANNFPVAIGDWRRAYYLADIGTPAITIDPYTTPGYTKYYVRRREGGIVLDGHAAKWLQTL